MKIKLIISMILMIGLITALPQDGGTSIDFTYPVSVNYSLVDTNNSVYWNGYAWSDSRWLNIDGSNANQDINISPYGLETGQLNITSGNTKIYTEILDAGGGNTVPLFRGIGGLYDIFAFGGGIIVDWKSSFPYGIIFANDEDDDGVIDNQIGFEWDTTNNILKLLGMIGTPTDFSVDGEIYANSTHKVCTVENNYCATDLTNYYTKTQINNFQFTTNESALAYVNSTGLIRDWNSTGYIINWSEQISGGDSLWVNESGIATYNGSINVRGDIQIKNKKTIEVDDDGVVNFYGSI